MKFINRRLKDILGFHLTKKKLNYTSPKVTPLGNESFSFFLSCIPIEINEMLIHELNNFLFKDKIKGFFFFDILLIFEVCFL